MLSGMIQFGGRNGQCRREARSNTLRREERKESGAPGWLALEYNWDSSPFNRGKKHVQRAYKWRSQEPSQACLKAYFINLLKASFCSGKRDFVFSSSFFSSSSIVCHMVLCSQIPWFQLIPFICSTSFLGMRSAKCGVPERMGWHLDEGTEHK